MMCGDKVYPTVVVRTVEINTSEEHDFRDIIFIFDNVLNKLVDDYESTVVSNQYTDSPEKLAMLYPYKTCSSLSGI